MRTEEKADVKNSIGRAAFVAFSVLIQVIWLLVIIKRFNEYNAWISMFTRAIGLVVVLKLYAGNMNAAIKMPWIIMILIWPVMGVSLYVLLGRTDLTRGMRKHFEKIDKELDSKVWQDTDTLERLEAKDLAIANQCRYIWKYGKYPVYKDTDVEYYAEAIDGFEAQKEAMKQAKEFIFMEYHAIEDAKAFGSMREILEAKAKEGVEVRIVYDDIGSIGFINTDFIKRMEAAGIQCRVFNQVKPFLDMFMNNRDHRKITIIDGKVGFTGGYNLADEYFNITHPYGQWKDTGIKLTGKAVYSLTIMFLEMWNSIKKTDESYDKYLVEYRSLEENNAYPLMESSCFVQPYADSPLDDEYVSENVYLNMIKNAKKYIYFMTPYLIISDEMNRELGLAAKRGVDVRIMTPGIPDKKMVYRVTRSYYAGLVKEGVRVYEYTPGFCHGKQCVADDEAAIIGTINLDFRSLYHHFENGVFLYNCQAVKDMKKDFDNTFPQCREVTEQYKSGRSAFLFTWQCVLRLFAPLL